MCYKNEAYVCGFVGMEANKDKAFEVWHRRPSLDLNVVEGDVQTMSSNLQLNGEKKETVVQKGVDKPKKKPGMIQKVVVKKGVNKPKAAVQTMMKKAMKRK